MYTLVQLIRHKAPFIWTAIEFGNNHIFRLRYGRKMKLLSRLITSYNSGEVFFSFVSESDSEDLSRFFSTQPEEAFEFFHPHKFDRKNLTKLIHQNSFIMLAARNDDRIVGYAFLRCFANGKAFRGKIVDINYRNRGIAKTFGKLSVEIAQTLGISLFGTISKKNITSMASSKSSNTIKVIEELPNDCVLVQYFSKQEDV